MSLWDRRSTETPQGESFTAQPYNATRTLTASAARVDLKNKKEVDAISKRRLTDKWQEEAYDYYDLIGEIKASANLISNVMSRINLYGGYVGNSAQVPSEISAVEKLDEEFKQDVADVLYQLESSNGGTSGLLRAASLNMFITGEFYLVREPSRTNSEEPDKYQVRSISEIVTVPGRKTSSVFIKPRSDSKPADYIPIRQENGFTCRMWRSHPRYSDEADSSIRGILEICDQLLLLDRAVSATAKSRLNAGLLFVPDGLSNASETEAVDPDDPDAVIVDDMGDSFEEELIESMSAPVADVGSAASVVPLVVRGPQDVGEKIKHIKFERAMDASLVSRADRLLDRILAGLDIPADVAKGLSGVKYSNAILIDEQLYKAHVEPLILLIADQLTVGFLRPALRHLGWPENMVSRAVVWYDPSQITAKPSKAEAAVVLFDKGVISEETLRRSNGFSDGDAPSQLERAQRLAVDRGLLDEQTSAMLLDTIIPEDIKQRAKQNSLALSDPDSANALSNALGTDPAAGGGPADATASPSTLLEPGDTPAESGGTAPAPVTDQAPPTLMEP